MTSDLGRMEAAPWRAWYKTRDWKHLRWECLSRDGFRCQGCRRLVADTSQLVADHKTPHRGNPELFWTLAGLQTLCKPCHDGAKQREERRGAAKSP
jgi:5-methylcytosine-specific restriction endonuclease McrA